MNAQNPNPTNWWKVLFISGTIFSILFCCCGGLLTLIFGSPVALILAGSAPAVTLEVQPSDEDGPNVQVPVDPDQVRAEFFAKYCLVSAGRVTSTMDIGSYDMVGILNREYATQGFSLEAFRDYVTDATEIAGEDLPRKEQLVQDGVQSIYCEFSGIPHIYVMDRTMKEDVPFNQASFFEMTWNGVATFWMNDIKHKEGWEGEPSGVSTVYTRGDAIHTWEVAYATYTDPSMTAQFDAMQELLDEILSDEDYVIPNQPIFIPADYIWTTAK